MKAGVEKEQYGPVIQFLFWKGKWMLYTVTLLLRWGPSEFGLTSFNVVARRFFDEPRPGIPKMAATEDNVTKIHDLLLTDRRFKLCDIAETIGISKDCVKFGA